MYECKKLSNYDEIKNTYVVNFNDIKNKPKLNSKKKYMFICLYILEREIEV